MARITDWDTEQRRILLASYGHRYDVWFVRSAGGRFSTWHARPKGAPVATMNAESPEDLNKLLASADIRAS